MDVMTLSYQINVTLCMLVMRCFFQNNTIFIKEYMSDSFTNYTYVGNTKVSVSIKKTYANKCTLNEIFLTEILKSFSVF